jgi:hypothetical protein
MEATVMAGRFGIGSRLLRVAGDDVNPGNMVENSLILSGGGGLISGLSELVPLWPTARARCYEARDENGIDYEAGLNLLFTWD